MGGYYVMYWGLSQHAAKDLRQQLDKGSYSENQTITIALPITLPYAIDRNYERIDGEFEYKGEFYKLVKQQLKHDTLFVVCIKDSREKHLVNEMINYAKIANDLPSQSSLKLFNSLLKDYSMSKEFKLITTQSEWLANFTFASMSSSPLFRDHPVNSPPPRIA